MTHAQISYMMSRIRSVNTNPDITLRHHLKTLGIKNYGLHSKVPENSDVVIPSTKIAFFVDECFWYGCNRCYKMPTSNKRFWSNKLENNIKRDKNATMMHKAYGWIVARFWEHQMNGDLMDVDRKVLDIGAI